MSKLKEFAAFVKEERLEEFLSSDLKMIQSFNVPLLQFFKHLSEQELRDQTRQGLVVFLNGLIDGNAIEIVEQNLRAWEEDKLPGIPKTAVSVADILLIYAAQKISLITLIPFFTRDAGVSVSLVLDLELYYKEVREMSLAIIQKIQDENKQKLLESEERYKDLFDNASDLIHIVSPEGKITYVNNAWLNTLKYSKEDLKEMNIYSLVVEDKRDSFRQYRESLLGGNADSEGITTCFITKDGNEIMVEGYLTCKFQDGKPLYTRGILRDITKKIEDEKKMRFYNEQLLEREENLTRLIENAPDAIIVIDEQNIIQLWNPKAEIIFGWKAEEVINSDLTQTIIPEEYRDAHNHGMRRFKATGVSQVINKTIEITAINKQNKTFYISLTISLSRQAGKRVFISFLRDITLQKQNEFELDNKRKQLEKSNEELEQYAWLASHDLKEPLRKIMTFSDILLTRYAADLPEVVQKHLRKINESTQRMDSLIEAIMVYSNVTNNENLFVETDLSLVIKEVLADLEIAIKKKNATIKVSALPTVEAIKIQMRQLLQNLISNAIKYSKPETPPVIDISSEVQEGNCIITIKDNGIGFHNQYAEKIFQVFQRLSTGERYEGTGIGLALCKKIAETHSGTIHAESEEGQGAVFTISIPVKHVAKQN
ncbi:MAG TPA: PAS domain S-box protein [Segetibacter sp.]|jgi:PAS domain S-box-containing protein